MNDVLTLDIGGISSTQVAQLLEMVRAMRAPETDRPVFEDDERWRNAESTGWTPEHVQALRDKLASRGNTVQLAAFDEAIANGGFLSRAELYDIGEYGAERRLNQWSTAFIIIQKELVADHALPKDAADAMLPDYGPGTGYRRLRGYSVAPEIVRLARA
ncbi:hypothetical protein [Leifsonia kafniensis]